MDPQPRGYAFEKFLRDMFDAYGLSARASFRMVGEQIDGSFVLGDDVYLLEAKWTSALVDAATLRSFNAKVEDKARWSRGLLIELYRILLQWAYRIRAWQERHLYGWPRSS